jgi:hypothetical protein
VIPTAAATQQHVEDDSGESSSRPAAFCFQAIQTSILPHLAGMQARGSAKQFHKAIRTTLLAIAAFASAVALGLLAIGPLVMQIATGYHGYARLGLAVVGVGMGLHLTSGTLNQALLARGRARSAAGAWLTAATAFVPFVATDSNPHTQVPRVETGYCGATALLALIYRRSSTLTSRSPA